MIFIQWAESSLLIRLAVKDFTMRLWNFAHVLLHANVPQKRNKKPRLAAGLTFPSS
jgi:hypothetical protein